MKITIEWLGGPSLRISGRSQAVVVDPLLLPQGKRVDFKVFQSKRLDSPAGNTEALGEADLWLFTHSHRDHWDETALELIPREGKILCAPDCRSFLRGFPHRKVLRPNRTTTINGENSSLEVTAVRTIHSRNPWFRPFIKGGNGYGISLREEGEEEVEEYRIYLTGDSLIGGAQRRFLKNFRPHLIIANAGAAYPGKGKLAQWTGPLTLGKRDLIQLADFYPNSRILPVHWGTFSHYRESYTELDFQSFHTIRLLEPGETWEIQR